MVVVDEYNRFPEVKILTSTSARAVIPKLDAIFSRQGIPDVLKSDIGPPFSSLEFKKFVEHLGFQHRWITPYWSKANGEAGRFMRTFGKSIRTANVEARNWKQDLYKFLRQYRATPHSTTSISPC
jgi:transposase InsO family protein